MMSNVFCRPMASTDQRTALQFVWVRLVQNGITFEPTRLMFKTEYLFWDIDAVKKAAKQEFAAKLQGLDADDLAVRATIDGSALRTDQAPPVSAQEWDSPLIIYVRPVTGELLNLLCLSRRFCG